MFFLLILEMARDASQICSWQRQMCHHGCKLNMLEGTHQSCLLIIAQRYNFHFQFSTHREMSTISMREIWLFSCRCFFLLICFVFDSKSIFGTVFFSVASFLFLIFHKGMKFQPIYILLVMFGLWWMTCGWIYCIVTTIRTCSNLKCSKAIKLLRKRCFFRHVCVCVCVIEKESLIVMLLNSHRFNCVPNIVFAHYNDYLYFFPFLRQVN